MRVAVRITGRRRQHEEKYDVETRETRETIGDRGRFGRSWMRWVSTVKEKCLWIWMQGQN